MNIIEKLLGTALTLGMRRNERGATATEYALLVFGIALAVIAAVALFKDQLATAFTSLIPADRDGA